MGSRAGAKANLRGGGGRWGLGGPWGLGADVFLSQGFDSLTKQRVPI